VQDQLNGQIHGHEILHFKNELFLSINSRVGIVLKMIFSLLKGSGKREGKG